MVEINGRIFQNGSTFAITIPKALVDCKLLEKGKRYTFVLKTLDPQSASIKKDAHATAGNTLPS